MRCVVVGALGFIGRHIVERLSDAGHDVLEVDSGISPKRYEGKRQMVLYAPGYKIEPETFATAVSDADVVINAARKPASDSPMSRHRSGATLTLSLLEAAVAADVKQFVQLSSSSVYGRQFTIANITGPEPCTLSGAVDTAIESYCAAYQDRLKVSLLRCFHVYGPGQPLTTQGVVPAFFHSALCGHAACIEGDGEQTRYFTYVRDVADACQSVLNDPSPRLAHNVYGTRNTILQLLHLVHETLGVELIRPVYREPRKRDLPSFLISGSRTLKYQLTALSRGLELSQAYFREAIRPARTAVV